MFKAYIIACVMEAVSASLDPAGQCRIMDLKVEHTNKATCQTLARIKATTTLPSPRMFVLYEVRERFPKALPTDRFKFTIGVQCHKGKPYVSGKWAHLSLVKGHPKWLIERAAKRGGAK